jgi:serine kinase of HPr protein (carbohydrate metabolism regulator)
MRLIEQKDKLNIENVDMHIIKQPSRHGSLLPDSIRGIFVGPSGSGKTNVMFNCITHRNGLKF